MRITLDSWSEANAASTRKLLTAVMGEQLEDWAADIAAADAVRSAVYRQYLKVELSPIVFRSISAPVAYGPIGFSVKEDAGNS
jgi:hypothetical protein